MSVLCPVCCKRGQHQKGCEEEQCLHFLSLTELYRSKQVVCTRSAFTKNSRVPVTQFAPWLPFKEQLVRCRKILFRLKCQLVTLILVAIANSNLFTLAWGGTWPLSYCCTLVCFFNKTGMYKRSYHGPSSARDIHRRMTYDNKQKTSLVRERCNL